MKLIIIVAGAISMVTGFNIQCDQSSGNLCISSEEPVLPPFEPLYQATFYLDGRVTDVVDNIGSAADTKVQTGTPVEDPYPFIGAFGEIGITSDGGIQYLITCTSSLIDSQTILTAAHCIDKTRQQGKILIFVHNLSDVRVTSYEDLAQKMSHLAGSGIGQVLVHPNYASGTTADGRVTIINDVAMAKLYLPLTSADGVQPICLATKEYTTNVTGAGWGMKDCYTDSQETLRRANGKVVQLAECNERLKSAGMVVGDQHLCSTFTLDNGEPAAVAKGDSGGPLFAIGAGNKPVQMGVVSFGAIDFGPGGSKKPSQYCMMKDKPQVYARVSSFRSFISQFAPNAAWC